MNFLFIHQNFPGQYRHLAPAIAQQGHTVWAIGDARNLKDRPELPGVRRIGYVSPAPGEASTHHYLRYFEGQVRRGQQVARALLQLQDQGFRPDIIVGHPGWGELLYVKDVFPTVPLMGWFEFYYYAIGQDVGFDPEFPVDLDKRCKIRTKNINNLLALEAVDVGVCPTAYQKMVQPAEFHHKLTVVHEGIDTDALRPNPDVQLTLQLEGGEITLTRDDEVITFVNRNLEPYRGYHVFMRALPQILQQRPHAHVIIIGGDGVSYGAAPSGGKSWKEIYWHEVKDAIAPQRVHLRDRIPYQQLIHLFQLSSIHVYLTYPFVLSWSMLEAMSCGCLVIGSRTAPVEEVIRDHENGLLVDFFDGAALCDRINAVFEHPTRMQHLREAARQTIINTYDLKRICLPQQLALIQSTLARSR